MIKSLKSIRSMNINLLQKHIVNSNYLYSNQVVAIQSTSVENLIHRA